MVCFEKMRKLRCTLMICLITFQWIILTNIVKADSYAYAQKDKLVYEITEVNAEANGYRIKGWAFINESQHYSHPGDLDGNMKLVSNKGNLIIPLQFGNMDLTYLMRMENRRRCGDAEYNKHANECYYDYKHVDFQAVIPFDQLSDNTTYTLYLQMHAKQTGKKYETEVFFVSENSIETSHQGRTIRIQAKLNQTYFYVNHDYVLARKSPSKSSAVHQASSSCSATFGKEMYFEKYSQFFEIQNIKQVQQVTWYQVLTKHKQCSELTGMHLVEEGGSNETWIPSTFINYNGKPATIEVIKENTPPVLELINPTVYVGDYSFRPEDYITAAYDLEDGTLIPIKGFTNLNINKVGTYMQEFSVYDSAGARTSKIMIIKVIDKPANTPPKIHARNQTVYQYTKFDPFSYATASDLEDGDITAKIITLNEIDTSVLGIQQQCYFVSDSGGLTDTACIQVNVIAKPVPAASTTLRFISQKQLFYHEPIPTIWIGREEALHHALRKTNPLLETILR